MHTFVCIISYCKYFALLPAHTPTSLDFCHSLLIILSFFLPLSVPLLCSFHTPFSTCFLFYTISDMYPLSGFIPTRRRANHLLMKQMASRCELLSQRARESFGFSIVRTFEIDHLAESSSFCAWEDKSCELYKCPKATQWSGSVSPISQFSPFPENSIWTYIQVNINKPP